jgi:uncharacterized protein (PEP-CTERM system associated)
MVLANPDRASGSVRRRGALDPLAGFCAALVMLPLAAGAQTPSVGGAATGGATGIAAAGAGQAGTGQGVAAGQRAAAGAQAADAATGPRASALRVGGLGFPVAADPLILTDRAWTLRPSIAVDLIATDNAFLTARNRESDLIVSVSPSISAAAQTARLTGGFTYRPTFSWYAANSGQERLDHFLNGQALATLQPDWLFLDIRANSNVSSLSGGLPTGATAVTSRANRLQTTSVQVSPYVQFRIPRLGTAQVGYSFQYVDQSAGGNGFGGGSGNTSLAGAIGGTPFLASGDFIAHEGFAVVSTGDEFGRLSMTGRLSAIEYDGKGVLDGAYRRSGVLQNSYAITRGFAALLDLGYEEQHYGGPRPFDVDGPIWAVGFQLTGPDSSVIAKYGRRDGFESFSLDSSVALTGRTRLVARYEERLTTTSQLAAQNLQRAQFDRTGNQVDPVTGIPVVPGLAENLLTQQAGLQRMRTAVAALTQSWERDTITLSLTRDEREPVNPDPRSFAQEGITGGLTWVRLLTPEVTGSLFGQYGRTETSGRGSGSTYSAGASLSRDFGQGLSGTMQYRYTNRGDYLGTGSATQNMLLVGLRKDFW